MNANAAALAMGRLALTAVVVMVGLRAQAQEQEPGTTLEEIIVEAPWQVRKKVVGRTSAGGKIEQISLTRRVDYSDLDLTKYSDVQELEKRIDEVAKNSCDALAQMYPLDNPNIPSCIDNAVEGAMAQQKQAIAAAQDKEVSSAPQETNTR
jgi:UrcA family protein